MKATPSHTNKKETPNGVSFLFALNLFLDLGSLAETVTQVVELRSADFAVTNGLHVDHVGRVNRENLLAADTVGDTANGDGFLNAGVYKRQV